MSNTYNVKNKRYSISDFQHPSEKKTVEKLIQNSLFEKIINFISDNSIEKKFHLINNASYLKLTEENAPKIFEMAKEGAEMFGITELPDLFVKKGYEYTVLLDGINHPFIIFNSSLLETYEDDMLWPLIASEMAGIAAGHSKMKFVDSVIKILKPVIPYAIDASLNLALNDWFRNKSYTFDRAFLLACDDFEMAAKGILYDEIDMKMLDSMHLGERNNEYYQQAIEFIEMNGVGGIVQKAKTVFSKSQWVASRYIELYNWYFSGEYHSVKGE